MPKHFKASVMKGKSRSKNVTHNKGSGMVKKIPPGFTHSRKTVKGK